MKDQIDTHITQLETESRALERFLMQHAGWRAWRKSQSDPRYDSAEVERRRADAVADLTGNPVYSAWAAVNAAAATLHELAQAIPPADPIPTVVGEPPQTATDAEAEAEAAPAVVPLAVPGAVTNGSADAPPPAGIESAGEPDEPRAPALVETAVAAAQPSALPLSDPLPLSPEAMAVPPSSTGSEKRAAMPIGAGLAATIHPAPPEMPPAPLAAADMPPDDLTRIRRIDRPLAAALHARGIRRFEQIAAFTPADVRTLAAALALGRRISQENWIEQAALLAERAARARVAMDAAPVRADQPVQVQAGAPKPVQASPSAPAIMERTAAGILDSAAPAGDAAIAEEPTAVETITDEATTNSGSAPSGDAVAEEPTLLPAEATALEEHPPSAVLNLIRAAAERIAATAAHAPPSAAPPPTAVASTDTEPAPLTADTVAAPHEHSEPAETAEAAGPEEIAVPAEMAAPPELEKQPPQFRVELPLPIRSSLVGIESIATSAEPQGTGTVFLQVTAAANRIGTAAAHYKSAAPITTGETVRTSEQAIEAATRASTVPANTPPEPPATEDSAATEPTLSADSVPTEIVLPEELPPQPPPADDLTLIRAIDAPLARTLGGFGIASFAEIAQWTARDVRTVAAALGLGLRISREGWIEQAAVLARGGTTTHAARRLEREAGVLVPPPAGPGVPDTEFAIWLARHSSELPAPAKDEADAEVTAATGIALQPPPLPAPPAAGTATGTATATGSEPPATTEDAAAPPPPPDTAPAPSPAQNAEPPPASIAARLKALERDLAALEIVPLTPPLSRRMVLPPAAAEPAADEEVMPGVIAVADAARHPAAEATDAFALDDLPNAALAEADVVIIRQVTREIGLEPLPVPPPLPTEQRTAETFDVDPGEDFDSSAYAAYREQVEEAIVEIVVTTAATAPPKAKTAAPEDPAPSVDRFLKALKGS